MPLIDASAWPLPRSRCRWILRPYRYGDPDPYCPATAVPGSSWCPEHRAVCIVDWPWRDRRGWVSRLRIRIGEAAVEAREG